MKMTSVSPSQSALGRACGLDGRSETKRPVRWPVSGVAGDLCCHYFVRSMCKAFTLRYCRNTESTLCEILESTGVQEVI